MGTVECYVPISGAGSTWSGNAFADWTSGVQQYGMRVDYLGGGSTVGRNDFKTATVTFGASDIPYGLTEGTTSDPPPQRGYAYIPDTAGGAVFMYNLPSDAALPQPTGRLRQMQRTMLS